MKAILFSALLIAALAPQAQAKEVICGKLTQIQESPVCNPGQLCSHMVRLVNVLTQTNGLSQELETQSQKVLTKFSQLKDQNVCVSGSPINDGQFEVTAIRKAVSAN